MGVSGLATRTSMVSWAKAVARMLVLFPAAYMFTVMWWIPEGTKYVPALVGIALVAFLCSRMWRQRDPALVQHQKPFQYALGLLTVFGMTVYFWHGASWTELRAFVFAFIYALVLGGLVVDRSFVKALLLLSGIGLISLSFYQYALGYVRVQGYINPIPFANGVAIVAFAVLFLLTDEPKKIARWAGYSIFVLLLIALLMTNTRGAILSVIVLGMGIFLTRIYCGVENRRRFAGYSALVLLVAAIGLYSLAENRLEHTVSELKTIQSGDYTTSIGLRLQLWQAAIPVFSQNPLLGSGKGHAQILESLIEQGQLDKSLLAFDPDHYHNQYIDMLVKRGFLGFMLFLALLWTAIKLAPTSQSDPGPGRIVVSTVVLYALTSLTDVPFHHPATIYLFVFLLLVMSGLGRHPRSEDAS